MTDTTAEIRAKKTGNTGLTEDIAKRFADAEKGRLLVIAELKVETVHKSVDSGDRKVDFVITDLEPIEDPAALDHVRNLQRALFMNRKLHSEDETLDIDTRSDLEPTVEGVLAARAKFEPHAYVDTADSICDVCGDPAGATLHQELTDDDPDDEPDAAPEPAAQGTEPDPWEYDAPEGDAKTVETVKDPFVTT